MRLCESCDYFSVWMRCLRFLHQCIKLLVYIHIFILRFALVLILNQFIDLRRYACRIAYVYFAGFAFYFFGLLIFVFLCCLFFFLAQSVRAGLRRSMRVPVCYTVDLSLHTYDSFVLVCDFSVFHTHTYKAAKSDLKMSNRQYKFPVYFLYLYFAQ